MDFKTKVERKIKLDKCPHLARAADNFFCIAYYDYCKGFIKPSYSEREILCTKSSYRLCFRYKRAKQKKGGCHGGKKIQDCSVKARMKSRGYNSREKEEKACIN